MTARKTNKVGVRSLTGVVGAETSLRRTDIEELVASLPPGHPLELEVGRVSAELNGDLAGLPEGHPLILQLRQARERFEASVEEELDPESPEKEARKVKRVQKVDRRKAKRAEYAKEDKAEDEHRRAAKVINDGIEGVMGTIKGLYAAIDEQEGVLNRDQMSKMRVDRLKRLLYAAERGLSGSKLNKVRMGHAN